MNFALAFHLSCQAFYRKGSCGLLVALRYLLQTVVKTLAIALTVSQDCFHEFFPQQCQLLQMESRLLFLYLARWRFLAHQCHILTFLPPPQGFSLLLDRAIPVATTFAPPGSLIHSSYRK